MPDFLYSEFYDNTVLSYLVFLLTVIVSWIAIKIIGKIIFKRLIAMAKKTKTTADDIIAKDMRKYLLPAAYFAAFYLSTNILTLSTDMKDILSILFAAFTIIMGAVFLSSIAVFIFRRYWDSRKPSGDNALPSRLISGLIKIIVWTIAILLFLDNIDVEITSLVAGLGIGGIAIAFAAQTILTDIFCYFTILFDRPFEIGDFIIAGAEMGTVEHIGVKTTRMRALSGEQLIFSNKDLTNSRIQNYKRMENRRVLFTLGVTYDTPYEKLKIIPGLIKQIIERIEDTSFGRAHFTSYGDFNLNFETAYYILSSDYDKFMDIHQKVNLEIKKVFDEHGIDFAFPTQTIQLSGPDKLPRLS